MFKLRSYMLGSCLVVVGVGLASCKVRKHNEGKSQSQLGVSYDPNPIAGNSVIYEVQIRSANSCNPEIGSEAQKKACKSKIAPKNVYRAEGVSCSELNELHKIKLGTVDDMLEDTADYRAGITLRYIQEKVGANMVWVMPLFPNNDRWSIPAACDNIGSPYGVRDYLHVAGTHSRACINKGKDEYSNSPCWGNDTFDAFIAEAHKRGITVMLDLAFNHFGHNYIMYDYEEYMTFNDRIEKNQDFESLWDFDANFEQNLVKPSLLDTEDKLNALVSKHAWHKNELASLKAKCPDLKGEMLLRYYNMWRNALGWEREKFQCTGAPEAQANSSYLEINLPGFYVGKNAASPSKFLGDNFTNDWRDVKFLFHHDENSLHRHEYFRNREYFFRIMNYWASRGVDGFRLDHTSDTDSGIDAKDWAYLTSKVSYYNKKRGQARPVFMAEEFHDQGPMADVVDVMTDGYVGDMRRGSTKNTAHVEKVLNSMGRHQNKVYVMTALETHDEKRLTETHGQHATGFDIWTGAGFWGIGLTTESTPMMLMGQEFGESWGLDFRKSDIIRSRFEGSSNYSKHGDALRTYYQKMVNLRLAPENVALRSSRREFLRNKNDSQNENIFAQVKWSSGGKPIFTFHNLWAKNSSEVYYIPTALADQMLLNEHQKYRFVDLFSGETYADCRLGKDIRWELPITIPAATRALWLRMEHCVQAD